MTKEKILQKHFTAEFGQEGHGKFMQYILNAMEEYAQQQLKNLNIPAVVRQSERCEHDYQPCKHQAVFEFDKCTKCGKII